MQKYIFRGSLVELPFWFLPAVSWSLCELLLQKKGGFWYLKYKLFPSEDGNGVKVSLTDVWAMLWSGYLRWARWRRRRRSPRLGPCGGKEVQR